MILKPEDLPVFCSFTLREIGKVKLTEIINSIFLQPLDFTLRGCFYYCPVVPEMKSGLTGKVGTKTLIIERKV